MSLVAWILIAYVTLDAIATFWTWLTGEWVQVKNATMWLVLFTHTVAIIMIVSLATAHR